MKRAEKEKIVKELADSFEKTNNFYLIDYKGMKASHSVELRKLMRENSFSFRVVKNRLSLKALKQDFPESLRQFFRGPTAVAYSQQNPLALARMLKNFSAQNNLLVVKGGMLEGQFLSPERFDLVANLTSREQLLSKIAYLMAYPLIKALRTWQAPLVNLSGLLSQLKTKK